MLGVQGAGRATGSAGRAAGGARQAGRHAGRWGADAAGRHTGCWGAGTARRRAAAGVGAGREPGAELAGQQAPGLGARRATWARGLARAVHSVHSAWFSTRFFDSVFFLSP